MTSLNNRQSPNFPIQLELPVMPQKIDPLKQMEQAIQGMLDLTWKTVLLHISPRSTKELMLQHGKLIALNDGEAWIQVSSTPLLLMAIQKLPDIESAFSKAFGTTVKIRMEV
jgi:DNA polymerase-3 subunit gamma/tau